MKLMREYNSTIICPFYEKIVNNEYNCNKYNIYYNNIIVINILLIKGEELLIK